MPGGIVKTAQQIWDKDKKRESELLSLHEIADIVTLCEHDFLEGNDVLLPLKEYLHVK